MYEKNGEIYEKAVGSRREVWNGTAHHTSGGLTRVNLKKNKRGRLVSKKKSKMAKQLYRQRGLKPASAEQMEKMRSIRRK